MNSYIMTIEQTPQNIQILLNEINAADSSFQYKDEEWSENEK